jgi:hypothetical protein
MATCYVTTADGFNYFLGTGLCNSDFLSDNPPILVTFYTSAQVALTELGGFR